MSERKAQDIDPAIPNRIQELIDEQVPDNSSGSEHDEQGELKGPIMDIMATFISSDMVEAKVSCTARDSTDPVCSQCPFFDDKAIYTQANTS